MIKLFQWIGFARIGARTTMEACMYSSSGQGNRVNPAMIDSCTRMVPESRVPTKMLELTHDVRVYGSCTDLVRMPTKMSHASDQQRLGPPISTSGGHHPKMDVSTKMSDSHYFN